MIDLLTVFFIVIGLNAVILLANVVCLGLVFVKFKSFFKTLEEYTTTPLIKKETEAKKESEIIDKPINQVSEVPPPPPMPPKTPPIENPIQEEKEPTKPNLKLSFGEDLKKELAKRRKRIKGKREDFTEE